MYVRGKFNHKNYKKTGGQILIECLIKHSIDKVFCVPGESYLAALDAFYDFRKKIKLINAKHEATASNMAEAYGKLTGKPGVAFVTRGPGACHASIGSNQNVWKGVFSRNRLCKYVF